MRLTGDDVIHHISVPLSVSQQQQLRVDAHPSPRCCACEVERQVVSLLRPLLFFFFLWNLNYYCYCCSVFLLSVTISLSLYMLVFYRLNTDDLCAHGLYRYYKKNTDCKPLSCLMNLLFCAFGCCGCFYSICCCYYLTLFFRLFANALKHFGWKWIFLLPEKMSFLFLLSLSLNNFSLKNVFFLKNTRIFFITVPVSCFRHFSYFLFVVLSWFEFSEKASRYREKAAKKTVFVSLLRRNRVRVIYHHHQILFSVAYT